MLFTKNTAIIGLLAQSTLAQSTDNSSSDSSSSTEQRQLFQDLNDGYNKLIEEDKTITQADMALINQYGCWCYFQEHHGQGRGHPIDTIDQHCKRLHDGYTCIIMDAIAIGEECVPWEITYNSAVGSGLALSMTIDTIRSECDVQNPVDGCARWTCKVEGFFVQQLLLSFVSGTTIDHSLRHENNFDWRQECPISAGVQSEKACCDEYPIRFPYKTYDGARDCCVTHTYNTNMYECCNDGSVKITC